MSAFSLYYLRWNVSLTKWLDCISSGWCANWCTFKWVSSPAVTGRDSAGRVEEGRQFDFHVTAELGRVVVKERKGMSSYKFWWVKLMLSEVVDWVVTGRYLWPLLYNAVCGRTGLDIVILFELLMVLLLFPSRAVDGRILKFRLYSGFLLSVSFVVVVKVDYILRSSFLRLSLWKSDNDV